jgi:hypothetical protein
MTFGVYPAQAAALCVVTSWCDWRTAFAWLMAIGITIMIYFLPSARLVE